jgi:hypothetical protein
MIQLVLELMRDELVALPEAERDLLLSRVVVFNPFDDTKLLPLQLLKPEPDTEPELQAFELTSLLNAMGGGDLGVRQDSLLYHLMLLGISAGLNLIDIASLLADPGGLAAQAAACPHPEVREYFVRGTRVTSSSADGVLARLHRLLRLPTLRRMLTASSSVSFHELLGRYIVFADLGSPPLGCEDLGRFVSQLVTLKLSRAVFQRRHEEARRPVLVVVDEWQEGVSDGAAERYERLLALARSRGVSFLLVSQSLAGAARVSATLPRVIATNTSVQMLFRASPEDARTLKHLLPVTGRRPRPTPAPWETGARAPFLSPSAVLDALVADISGLPSRTFYLWNRNLGAHAVLTRADNVSPGSRSREAAALDRRLQQGALRLGPPPRIRFVEDEPLARTLPAEPVAPQEQRGRPRRR